MCLSPHLLSMGDMFFFFFNIKIIIPNYASPNTCRRNEEEGKFQIQNYSVFHVYDSVGGEFIEI